PGVGAGPGTVAAPGLAADHGGADGLLGAPVGGLHARKAPEQAQELTVLGAPVGGLHARNAQECEQMLTLAGDMVEQSTVGWVAGGPGHQLVDLRAEAVWLSGAGDGVHSGGRERDVE